MKQKEVNVIMLIGTIFGLIGLFFSVIGIVFFFFLDTLRANATGNGDIIMLPLTFTGIGVIMLGLGLAMCVANFMRKKKIKRLMEEGQYIYAEVKDVIMNYNVTINGRHPFVLECSYEDPYTSEIHVFHSGNLNYRPSELIGTEIRIWVDRNNYSVYHVDTESVTKNVTIH